MAKVQIGAYILYKLNASVLGLKNDSEIHKKIYKAWDYIFLKLRKILIAKFN